MPAVPLLLAQSAPTLSFNAGIRRRLLGFSARAQRRGWACFHTALQPTAALWNGKVGLLIRVHAGTIQEGATPRLSDASEKRRGLPSSVLSIIFCTNRKVKL